MAARAGGKTCARCIGQVRATCTKTIAVDNEKFQLSLCDQHASAFDRDIGAWLRVADEVTPPNSFGPAALEITRSRERERRKPSVFIPDELAPGQVHVQRLPPTYHQWKLSDHAKQRCGDRDVSERDALITASDPAVCFPTPSNESEWFYRRGPIRLVVNPKQKVVITVLSREEAEQLEGVSTG